jgi:hypothetical protein
MEDTMTIDIRGRGGKWGPALAIAIAALGWGARAHAALRCAVDSECTAPRVCRQGVCRTPCSADGDCDATQSESCVVGQCMTAFAVPYPVDYGVADSNKQPGCNSDDDCVPNIACVGGVCQLSDQCIANGEARNEACPPFGGYTCNKTSKHCEGPSCTVAADCTTAANYPISGLHCISGRCTTACTSGAQCCSGTGVRCPTARAQSQCFQVDTSSPGVCAREIGTGRLIAYQIANPDPRLVRNIVLLSEGFRMNGSDRTELDHFVNQALSNIQWQTTRADMLAALLSPSLFNIWILELPDRFAGLGQPTLFGHYSIGDDTTWQYPGSDDQVKFMTKQAMLRYEQTVTPALTPAPSINDVINTFHVVLFNGNTDKRAHSNGGDMIFQLVNNNNGDGFSTDRFGRYFVLQHEFGHSLGRTDDEYDNDKETGTPPMCSFNTVARTTVTDPPCDECTTSVFLPGNATWSEFVNTTTFPTTTGSLATVGLYSGADAKFTKKAMRSQNDCTMRQGGRQDYCTACREALMHNVIGDGASQTFRYLDFPTANLVPVDFGLGPNLGIAVDTTRHHAYFTREISTQGAIGFSDVDGDVLTRDGITDLNITGALGGADVPRVISPFGQFVMLEAINATDATQSRFLVYNADAHNLGSSVAVPGLLGVPAKVSGSGALGSFTVYRRDPTSGTNQMAFLDIGTSGPAVSSFQVPTDRPNGMPRLEQAPVFAPTANLLFFPATKVTPAETFCDFDQCQIWAFNPVTNRFVDPIVTVTTPGVSEAGIVAMTVGQHPTGMTGSIPGELLIAVTDTMVFVWQTAQLVAGNTTPAASFAHTLGVTSLVTGVGFVPQTEQIVVTNRAGVVMVYDVRGTNGGDQIHIPGLAPGMEIRDLVVSPDGAGYIAAGGFSGPRAGVLAVLDLTGNKSGDDRVVFTQPVSGIGLARPAIAVDDARSVVYSNAVVESGDNTGIDDSHRYRSPLVRGLHETRSSPSGCP